MAIRSQWRAWLCLAAILGVIMFCASQGKARAEAAPVALALAPLDLPSDKAAARAPFNLEQAALSDAAASAMTARWKALQANIAVESRVLTLCRRMPDACPPTAARFVAIIDTARQQSGRARAGLINREINLAIGPSRDIAQFGISDVWQSPLMTFGSGRGDCEDYAIAKYVALREAGMNADDLKLVIVHDARNREDHAVTAARIDGEWLILDNRKMLLLSDAQAPDLKPLIALGDEAQPVLIRDAGLDARFAATMAG